MKKFLLIALLLALPLVFAVVGQSARANIITGTLGCNGVGFSLTYLTGGVGCGAAPPPPACASPTAPNGAVDLSVCSNAYYVALIF